MFSGNGVPGRSARNGMSDVSMRFCIRSLANAVRSQMRVGPEQTAGPAEAEARSAASRGIDAGFRSVATIAASAHGGIRRPVLCLKEAEVSSPCPGFFRAACGFRPNLRIFVR